MQTPTTPLLARLAEAFRLLLDRRLAIAHAQLRPWPRSASRLLDRRS
jgi:hypothetical protein